MDDDDYMSENIIEQCQKNDVRPGLLYTNRLKRDHELHKKQENSIIKPLHVLEEERREAGLQTKIPETNKGFELLKKMGYKPGAGIGKDEAGPSDPVNIVKKKNRLGLGVDKSTLTRSPPAPVSADKFRVMLKRKREMSDIKSNYFKLQRLCYACDDTDELEKPLYKWFWPKYKIVQNTSDESSDSSDSEEQDRKMPKLIELAEIERRSGCMEQYLRGKYLYCQYCQMTFNDDEDMQKYCPGRTKQDHENEFRFTSDSDE